MAHSILGRVSARHVVILLIVLEVALAIIWLFPRLCLESEVIRDRQIQLGEEQAHVVVEWIRTRTLLEYPHGALIGGGTWRYDTTIEYVSGQRVRFTTKLPPMTLWKSAERVFVACTDGSEWFLGEMRNGRLVSIPRAALPGLPPSWNLQPKYHIDLDESFRTGAK